MCGLIVRPVLCTLSSLDLDKWIYEPPSESEEESKDDGMSFLLPSGGSGGGTFGGGASYSPTESPKGKKKKRRSKRDQEEEEEMKRVSLSTHTSSLCMTEHCRNCKGTRVHRHAYMPPSPPPTLLTLLYVQHGPAGI